LADINFISTFLNRLLSATIFFPAGFMACAIFGHVAGAIHHAVVVGGGGGTAGTSGSVDGPGVGVSCLSASAAT
jgi:hypothetical protein